LAEIVLDEVSQIEEVGDEAGNKYRHCDDSANVEVPVVIEPFIPQLVWLYLKVLVMEE